MRDCKGESGIEVLGAQIFEVMNGEVILTSDKKIVALFNSLRNNIRRGAGYRIINLTLLMELPPDNPVGWVSSMGDSGGDLLSKSCCYFYIAGVDRIDAG